MNSSERSEMDIILNHDPSEDLEIELWDWDLLCANDLIGTFHIHINQDDYGNFSTILRKLRLQVQPATCSIGKS